ncbi:hypothetical protein NUM3379_01380 [Kineococcus sp. NUM-3379]
MSAPRGPAGVRPAPATRTGAALACCALVSLLCGTWALAVTGLVPAGTAVAAGLGQVLVCALRAAPRGTSRTALRPWGCGLLAGAVTALLWWRGEHDLAAPLALAPVLTASLATGVAAAADGAARLRGQLLLGVLTAVLAAAAVQAGTALAGPLLTGWAALACGLVLAQAPDVAHPAAARPATGSPCRVRELAAPVAVATLVAGVLLVAAPLPGPGGTPPLQALAGRLRAADTGTVPGTAPGGSPGQRRASAYASGHLDLHARGTLGEEPLLAVPAASPTWWRAAVLDTYDGRSWSTAVPAPSWHADADGFAAHDPDVARAAPVQDHEVTPLGAYRAVVSPGAPLLVRPGRRAASTAGSALLLHDRAPYVVTSTPQPAVGATPAAGTTGTASRSDAGPRDDGASLQLPDRLPRRVRDLAAQLAEGPGGRREHVLRVEDHLRRTARYSLAAPVPAPGRDAVDVFLFEDAVGFCEHFASAEVVLLRAAGVPARLAAGFAGGHTAGGGTRVLRSRDAHAWVEVWLPGQGWAVSDPTAGSTPAAVWTSPGHWLAEAAATRTGRALLLAGLLAAAAAAAAGAAGAGALRRRRRPEGTRPAGPRGTPPVLAALDALDAALAPAGLARGRAEDLRAFALRLRALGEPAAADAVTVAAQACYAPSLPEEARVRAACAALHEAAARHGAQGRAAR